MATQDTTTPPPESHAPSAAVHATPRESPAPPAANRVDPDCEPAALPPVLSSYDAITDGVVFSLALEQDEHGVWTPAERLAMPLHHASSIHWERRELLEVHAGARVVVIATGLGRTSIEHDARWNTFFATYTARVERVCPAQDGAEALE